MSAYNEEDISNATDLKTLLVLMRVGDPIELQVIRDGKRRYFTARIGDPYEGFVTGRRISRKFAGALLGEVVDRSSLGTNPGIGVGPVEEDSNAWHQGLREGDVVFQVNRARIKTLDDLREAAQDEIYRIKLRRGKRLISLVSR